MIGGLALTAATLVAAGSAEATTGNGSPAIQRLAGGDRFTTAIAVSQHGWAATGSTGSAGQLQAGGVVLARGDEYADALAGVPFAASKSAPILLTDPDALRDDVRAEIERVLPRSGTVYILGGPNAISLPVEQQIRGLGYNVVRFQGADRFHTALAIVAQGFPDLRHLYVATGTDYADALVAGPLAAHNDTWTNPGMPSGQGHGAILLTNDFGIAPDIAAFIRSFEAAHPQRTVGIGNHACEAMKAIGPIYTTFSCLAGSDRYGTARAVAVAMTDTSQPTAIGIAAGTAWPDALTGGAYAAVIGAPVFLPDPAFMAFKSWTYLTSDDSSKNWPIANVYVFGGRKAVDDATFAYVKRVTNAH